MRLLNPRCPSKNKTLVSNRTFKCQLLPNHPGLHFWSDGPGFIRWDDNGHTHGQDLRL